MDARPEALAEEVRAKRYAIDNDLELLRVRVQKADPRRLANHRWLQMAAPIVAGVGAAWWWGRRRRSVSSLEQLLVKELADLYASEQLLIPALQRMSAKATNPELQAAFEGHRLETIGQVERLERVFRSVGARPKRGAYDAVAGVIAETDRLLKRKVDPDVRDAWLIASAQRIEHIEIANYGTARTFADTLAYTKAAELLQQTLEEERAADEKLTNLAERFVNPQSIRSARTALLAVSRTSRLSWAQPRPAPCRELLVSGYISRNGGIGSTMAHMGRARFRVRSTNFDQVKALALALPDVEAMSKYDGSPVLKVHGVFMAGLATHRSAEPGTLVVRVRLEEREWLLADAPEIYYVTDYYRKHPVVLVRLSGINRDALRDVLSASWRLAAAKVPQGRRPYRHAART